MIPADTPQGGRSGAPSPDQRARADRRAVYAVAIGDRLGLDDEALGELRRAAEASVASVPGSEGLLGEILVAAIAFDSAVWPQSGPVPTEEGAWQAILDAAESEDARKAAEALGAVRLVIQPVSK